MPIEIQELKGLTALLLSAMPFYPFKRDKVYIFFSDPVVFHFIGDPTIAISSLKNNSSFKAPIIFNDDETTAWKSKLYFIQYH